LGVVIGPHPLTAEAGLGILRAGGNAFDAMAAAAFTEGVVQPSHNAPAGYGGHLVAFHAREGVVCLDFNSEAPAAASGTMFPTRATPDGDNLYEVIGHRHRHGALAVGIPGVTAGLAELLRCWGTLSPTAILAPGIRAARDGFEVNTANATTLADNAEELRRDFPETARLLTLDRRIPKKGDTLTNPELAATYERWAEHGLRDLYEGQTAARVAEYIQAEGGILTREDLAQYQARHVEPLHIAYRGHDLYTPPIGAGGVTSLQLLQALEDFPIHRMRPGSAEFMHLFIEAMKSCWRRKLTLLGDSAFTGLPESSQWTPQALTEIRAEIRRGLKQTEPGERVAPDPFLGTSHLCAADAQGNLVSLTQTHGSAFGSWVTVPGTGLTLGHGMCRFEPRPGWPNSIAPGKRPLQNMAPFLITRNERPWAAIGAPGGRTIPNNLAYFILHLLRWRTDVATALASPRVHCEEAEPAKVEDRADPAVVAELERLGHQVEVVEKNGGPGHGIVIGEEPNSFDGATDPRQEGRVAWA